MRTRTKLIAAVPLAAALFAGSIASAAWLAGGSFSFAVPGGEITKLEVLEASVNTDGLLPTQTADLRLRVKNTNPITVRGVVNANEPAIVTSSVAGCEAHLSVNDEFTSSHAFVDERFEPGQVKTYNLPDVVTLSNESPDECEGADYSVKVRTSATSVAAAD